MTQVSNFINLNKKNNSNMCILALHMILED